MPLVIPDDILHAAGMSEREAKVEIACRWFDAAKLSFGHAARLAGLDETMFDRELVARQIPRYRITDDMFSADVETLKRLGRW